MLTFEKCARCEGPVGLSPHFFPETGVSLCEDCGQWYCAHLDRVRAPAWVSDEPPHVCETCQFMFRGGPPMLTFEKMARDYVELHGGKFVSTRPVGDGRRSTLVQYPTGGFVSIVSKYEPVLVTLEGGYDALWSSFMDFATRYKQNERTVAA